MALPVYTRGYTPSAAGVQNPGKYPMAVGKNYLIWGEQPGWVYYPWSDKYVPDPNAQKTYGESTGLLEKETEAKTNTVSPAAQLGAAALLSAVPIATKSLTGALLGEGGKEAATAAVGATSGGGGGLLAAGGQSEGKLLDESFLGEYGKSGDVPWFGEGGSFYNTSGMYNDGGMFGASSPGMSMSNLGVGNYLGAAAGSYGVYDATKKQNKTSGITQGAMSGAMAGGSIVPGWGHLVGAVVGGLLGATAHESTKHRTGRRYDELARTSSDAAFQKLLSEGREMSLAGKDTWDIGDDKASAPLDLMAKSYGVLKAFGPSWANYSPEQQKAVVQEMVNNDLINSKQGEWLVDDTERANQILQSVGGSPAAAAMAPASATTSNAQAPAGGPSIEDIANIIPWVELKDDETTTPAAPQAAAPVVAPAYIAMTSGVGGPQGLLAARAQQQQNPLKVNAIGGNKFLGGPLRFQ